MHDRTRFRGSSEINQRSFANAEYALKKMRTRREKFLADMERVVPWARLIAVIEPLYPTIGTVGRQPIGVGTTSWASTCRANRCLTPPRRSSSGACYQWHFGMKAHFGVNAPSGLVHSVVGTANYQGVHKRMESQGPTRHVAMRRGKRRKLDEFIQPQFLAERAEKMKASIRAKVEHPLHVIKNLFGHRKARYKGVVKNTAQLLSLFGLFGLFGLPNLVIAERSLLDTHARGAS
jgi:hypothetical protein